MKAHTLALTALLAVAGCSSNTGSNQRALSGQLDPAQVHLVGAQAIATARDGRVFRAPVAATGAFRLVLPVNATYTLRFANTTAAAGVYDSFAVLAPRSGRDTFRWTAGADVNLGRVGAGIAATTLQPASDSESSDDSSTSTSSDSETDTDSEVEDDGATACDLAAGKDEVEVESEHDLLAEVDTDHDGQSDAVDQQDDRAQCTASAGPDDDCNDDRDDEQEMDDDHAMACGGGGGAAGGTAPVNGVVTP